MAVWRTLAPSLVTACSFALSLCPSPSPSAALQDLALVGTEHDAQLQEKEVHLQAHSCLVPGLDTFMVCSPGPRPEPEPEELPDYNPPRQTQRGWLCGW